MTIGMDWVRVPLPCKCTPGWQNKYSAMCALYESGGHRAVSDFTLGQEYTNSDQLGPPRLNCLV